MSRQTVNDICKTFPGSDVSDPWGGGHDAWKVGGKMFASMLRARLANSYGLIRAGLPKKVQTSLAQLM